MNNANTQAGDFDLSFGQNGIVEIPPVFAPLLPRNFTGMTKQDDHILVSTLAIDSRAGRHYGIARLTLDGSQDETFGDGGLVVGRFDPNEHAQPEALATLDDGSIVMLGLTADSTSPFPQPRCVVFSKDGKGPNATFELETPENTALIVGSGRLAASSTHVMIAVTLFTLGQPATRPRIYRMDHAGNPGFPHGSFIEIDFLPDVHEVSALIQCHDGFLVSGTRLVNGKPEGFIARYDNTGTLDPAFGAGGAVAVRIETHPTRIRSLVKRPNGALVALGDLQTEATGHAWAWQFTVDGTVDPSFNNARPVQEDAVRAWHNASLDAEGRLVAFGMGSSLAYKRYLIDGSPDGDYRPQHLIGTVDAMMCLNNGSNTLLGYNATAGMGLIGTVVALHD